MDQAKEWLKKLIDRLIALTVGSLPMAFIVVPIEWWIIRNAYLVADFRILSGLFVVFANPIWEKSREPIRAWLQGDSNHWLLKWLADGIATFIFKIIIFWICAAIFRPFGYPLTLYQVGLLTAVYFIENVFFVGGLSGKSLDWLRKIRELLASKRTNKTL